MELDRWAIYLLGCEALCATGALLAGLAGRWDIAASAWALACYCAINRLGKE